MNFKRLMQNQELSNAQVVIFLYKVYLKANNNFTFAVIRDQT